MNLKLSIVIFATTGLMHASTYGESILDSAAQLIPQDPKHSVINLVQNDTVNDAKPAPEKKTEISGPSASGETQAATIDQNGRWSVTEKSSFFNTNLYRTNPYRKPCTQSHHATCSK